MKTNLWTWSAVISEGSSKDEAKDEKELALRKPRGRARQTKGAVSARTLREQ